MKAEKDYQLHLRQICLFFIAFSPILRVFMLPSLTAQISGEDMWISSVFNVLIDFISIIAIIIIKITHHQLLISSYIPETFKESLEFLNYGFLLFFSVTTTATEA